MKPKYPVEAFALAMILCTHSLTIAIPVGSLLIFGTLAGMVGRVVLGEEKRMQEVELMITFFAVFGSIYLSDPAVYSDMNSWQAMITIVAVALLAAKFVWQLEPQEVTNYKTVLIQSCTAFAVLLVIALLREILGSGTLLGHELMKQGLVSSGYSHTFFGYILAGFGLSIVNRVYNLDLEDLQSALLVIPTAIIASPFVVEAIPEAFSMVIALFLVVVYLVSVKGRLVFSDTQKTLQNMPSELISVGIVYMFLSFF